jgi:Uma2 family endonuclease
MATTTEPAVKVGHDGETRFMLWDIGWSGYETMLALVGDGHVRLSYDQGDLELISPSQSHERFKKTFGRFVEVNAMELRIRCEPGGSTTWRREDLDRGLEPDECYYIANAGLVAGREADLSADPPPDLAIELVLSPSRLDRMRIYAGLGIPEVWRFNGETLRFHVLGADGTYTTRDNSRGFPFLTPAEVLQWVLKTRGMDHTEWACELQAWVHAELKPRLEHGSGQ